LPRHAPARPRVLILVNTILFAIQGRCPKAAWKYLEAPQESATALDKPTPLAVGDSDVSKPALFRYTSQVNLKQAVICAG